MSEKTDNIFNESFDDMIKNAVDVGENLQKEKDEKEQAKTKKEAQKRTKSYEVEELDVFGDKNALNLPQKEDTQPENDGEDKPGKVFNPAASQPAKTKAKTFKPQATANTSGVKAYTIDKNTSIKEVVKDVVNNEKPKKEEKVMKEPQNNENVIAILAEFNPKVLNLLTDEQITAIKTEIEEDLHQKIAKQAKDNLSQLLG